jgi:hypothetical protein
MREIVHGGGDFRGTDGDVLERGSRRKRRLRRRALRAWPFSSSIDAQERQALADIVVQLARDALPLDLLARNQPSGELRPGGGPPRLGDVADDAEDTVRVRLGRSLQYRVIDEQPCSTDRLIAVPRPLGASIMSRPAPAA